MELILGIESSCDDTGAALVDRNGNVLGSAIAGQEHIHNKFGGVFPEFASRAHVQSIIPAIIDVFDQTAIRPTALTAIGATRGPGLIGSLLIGLNTAAALGYAWEKPVIGINHLRGHLRSADLEGSRLEYPAIVLLVSGGHTLLAHLQCKRTVRILGATRDDSVGEAYDKVARMLGVGFPGGPIIDKLASEGAPTIPLPRPLLKSGLDFSFSGLKSAVARHIASSKDYNVQDVAASFVEACLDVLTTKSKRALLSHSVESFAVVGGVSASGQLRERMAEMTDELCVKLCLPPLKWSTDNAAMIGLAAFDYIDAGIMPGPRGTPRLAFDKF